MTEIVIVGDVRYSNIAKELYNNEDNKNQAKFLVELQGIMIKYGVIKLDVCLDAFGLPKTETGL